MKTNVDKIIKLVNSYKNLYDMAYTYYKLDVDMYISLLKNDKDVSENELCLLLDYLLNFCADDRILQIYKKLLRAMVPKYPYAVSDYIKFYKEEFED